ncbi:hypothetical protein [Roseivirga sp. 4D4]|nr:hypothetical protein [Roseivirga sp. 4D4]
MKKYLFIAIILAVFSWDAIAQTTDLTLVRTCSADLFYDSINI